MFKKGGYVYITCSRNRSTLYTGVTSNLKNRIYSHRAKSNPNSFSARYNCVVLVYYNFFDIILAAISEEKRIKGGSRAAKIALIESINPEWSDLWEEVEKW